MKLRQITTKVLEKFGELFGEGWWLALVLTIMASGCLVAGLMKGNTNLVCDATVIVAGLVMTAFFLKVFNAVDKWLAQKERDADRSSDEAE